MKNLVQDLKNQNFRHIYLFTGEEVYLRNQYKKKLQEALIPPEDTVNINFYQGKGIDLKELIAQAETMPFFSERRLLVVAGALGCLGWYQIKRHCSCQTV